MGETGISWCTKTWNVAVGCTETSEACVNCWAKRTVHRLAHGPANKSGLYDGLVRKDKAGKLHWTGAVAMVDGRLDEPLHWREPQRVFVASQSDLFHEKVTDRFIYDVHLTMRKANWHTYLLLTKRVDRAVQWYSRHPEMARLPNVWAGVTAENQQRADERIPVLLQVPAAVRFVSVEPMLSAVDLTCLHYEGVTEIDALNGTHGVYRPHRGRCARLSWVICGCESGPKARPMQWTWAESLKDQCVAAQVPFYFKQAVKYGALEHMPTLDGRVWDEVPA